MDLPQVPRRHQQRSVLVLDQVGHDLHHGRFDGRWKVEGRAPVDGSLGVPLRGGALTVQLARGSGPQFVAPVQAEGKARAARFDERSACGEAP